MRACNSFIIAGGLIAFASACSDSPSCFIEDVVAGRLEGTTYTDCGNLEGFEESVYRAAHDCVVASLAAGEPFAVIWTRPADDSRIASGYIGVPVSGGVQLQSLYYDSDPSGGSDTGEVTLISSCAALIDLDATDQCTLYNLNMQLCFECSGQGALPRCPPL